MEKEQGAQILEGLQEEDFALVEAVFLVASHSEVYLYSWTDPIQNDFQMAFDHYSFGVLVCACAAEANSVFQLQGHDIPR